jgi:hypothetical protein
VADFAIGSSSKVAGRAQGRTVDTMKISFDMIFGRIAYKLCYLWQIGTVTMLCLFYDTTTHAMMVNFVRARGLEAPALALEKLELLCVETQAQLPQHSRWGLGFGVWGLGFRVWDLGFRDKS